MSDGEQLAADLAALGTTALAAADALAVPELDVPAPTAPSPALSPAASPDLNAIGIAPDALEAAVVDLPPAEPPSPMSSLSPATPAVTLSPPDGPPEPLSVPSLANGNDNILAVSSKEAATDGASVLPNRAPSPDAPKPIPMARPAVAAPAVPEPAPPYEPLPEDGLPLSDGHVPGEFEPGSSKPESPIVDQLQSVPGMAPEDVATVAAELRAEGRDEPLPPSTTPEAVAAAAREIRDLEAQGLTWPLEKYLGPLHLFRRLVLLLIVVNLVFIAGYFRLSYAAVILIVVAVVPVYRRELNLEEKRIKYRASEEKRLAAMDTGMAESAEWLNFALDRYWQAFEPYLSQQIVDILNESLKKFKPAVLHSIEIEQCTLGTRAPRVTDFRSWSKGGPHILKLQTVLSFIPPTAADRAAYFESRKKAVAAALYEPNTTAEPQTFPPMPAPRECRIVMAVRFGRGNVKIPVLIELSQVLIEEFEAVVTIQLSSQFPHLHSINICVPDASAARRTIDFSLRPLLALDLVSLPVLKDAINSAIDNAIRGALSKPNPTTGDLGVTIRIAKPKDASIADHPEMALGIIRCRLISAVNLRGKGDYRASLKIGGRTVLRTGVQPDNSAPLWDYVEDVPISAMVFANRNERSDEVWIEIEDMDLHHTMHKPLRTRKLRLSQWIDIGKKYASREEVMALPGDSFDRRVVEAWGLPPTMDLLSKKLIDPSNTLKVGAGAEEGDVPQVQMILRWFSIDEVKHEMPELHPNAQTADASVRTGLVTITIHQAMNLKDKTALVPTFEQSSESSGSSGNNSAVGALAKGVTGAVKGAINVVSAGANTVTSLVTGAFEPFVSVVRVNKGAKDWEEQVEVFRTSARLSAAGNPVWNVRS
ncbi:hypothetical protein DFJ74DRAFT_38358 [Hyaloraphidium curvatum]|nr:hypothetical protein DFJ74DRAFT_38358 [Hyaloraphidium curvatum]